MAYTPISNLEYHIQKILPIVYDDSLSYYELLGKVVAQLNQLTDVVNLYGGQIENAVRDTLAGWLDDGTLNEIISEEIFAGIQTSLADPRKFGAKGDGITDDATALEQWLAAPGRSKVLRNGIFMTSRGLISTEANREIRCEGGILKAISPAVDITMLTIRGTNTTAIMDIDGANKAAIGVFIDGVGECRVINGRIKNLKGIGIGGCGVKAQTNLGCVIDNNSIINVDSVSNATIGDNIGASRAILLTDDNNSIATNPSRICNNYIENIVGEEGDGIQILFYDGISTNAFLAAFAEVKYNTIKNVNRRAIKIQASHCSVTNNKHINTLTSLPNSASVFEIINSHYVTMEFNHGDATDGFKGINIQGSSGVVLDNLVIRGNVIRGDTIEDAIYANEISDSVFSDNIIYDGKRGISIGNARNTVIKNNVLWGGTGADVGINVSQTCIYMHVHGNTQAGGSRTGLIAASATYSVVENNHSANGVCIIGSSVAARTLVRNNSSFSNTDATLIGNFSTGMKGQNFNVGSGGAGVTGQIMYGTATPTTHSYNRGDIVINTSVNAGGSVGWVCVTAGSPGTWKSFGTVAT